MSWPGNVYRKLHGMITKRPANFSWLDESVAGCGRPSTLTEVKWLKSRGITALLSLAEERLPESWVREANFRYLHVPIANHSSPNPEALDKAAQFISDSLRSGKVAVHCAAGSGRTGTVLAAYLIKANGFNADKAIRTVREKRPGSVEPVQEVALQAYYKILSGRQGRD